MRCGIYVLERLVFLEKVPSSVIKDAEKCCTRQGLMVRDLLECLGDEWQGVKSDSPFLPVPYIAGMNLGRCHHYVLIEGYDEKWIWGCEECRGAFKLPLPLFRFFWSRIAICCRV